MPKRVSSDSTPSYADQPLAQRLRTSPPPGAAGVPGAPGAPAAAGAGGGSPPNAALSHMPGLRIRPGQPPVDLYAQGGPHGTTRAHSKRGEQESNHTPPQATYRGTPFEHLHPDNMPAISMAYSDHRNKKGGIGAATSTGSSHESKGHRDEVQRLMTQGQFADAMILDHNDIKNTTAPNRGAYVPALAAATVYAKDQGLITPLEAARVLDALRKDI